MQFAQGESYGTQSPGVGAYLIGKKQHKSASDAFLKMYDTLNKWEANKERQKMERRKYIDAKLADLDFETEGVLPSPKVRDWLLKAKDNMLGGMAAYGVEGQDPFSQDFLDAYNQSNAMKKQYQATVDQLVEVNKIYNDVKKKYDEDPTKYDAEEVASWFESVYTADVVGDNSVFDVIKNAPSPRQATLGELWDEKLKDSETEKTTKVKGGAVYEVESTPLASPQAVIDNYNDDILLRKQTQDQLNPVIISANKKELDDGSPNPNYENDKNYIESLQAFADQKEVELGRPVTLHEALNIRMVQDRRPVSESFKSWTPYYRESAKIWGNKQKDRDKYENNIYNTLKMVSMDADWEYDPETGEKYYPSATNKNIGYYTDASGKAVKNFVIDLKGTIDPGTGKNVFRVATSETKAAAIDAAAADMGFSKSSTGDYYRKAEEGEEAIADDNGFIWADSKTKKAIEEKATDMDEYYNNLSAFQLVETMSNVYDEDDRGKFLNYFKEVSESSGIWDGAQKSPTAKTIKDAGLFSGWGDNIGKAEITKEQQSMVDYYEQSPQFQKDAPLTDRHLANFKLLEEQKYQVKAFVLENGKNPTFNELKEILNPTKKKPVKDMKFKAPDGKEYTSAELLKMYTEDQLNEAVNLGTIKIVK